MTQVRLINVHYFLNISLSDTWQNLIETSLGDGYAHQARLEIAIMLVGTLD